MHEPNPFSTETRVHVGLAVRELEPAIRFYEVLFGQSPTKTRPGYAKFEPVDPPVNLSLNEVSDGPTAPASPAEHFGVQVRSPESVRAAAERFEAAGLATDVEEGTACCYAVQDKVWVTDPDGHRWEVFVVLDADARERKSRRSDCCT